MRLCFLLYSTFTIQLLTFSQQPNFSFQKVEGLSQNTVFSICQDKQGFLWVATGDGLNRYDGQTFRSYKPSTKNEAGFITGRVIRNKIIEGHSNSLWLSTEAGLHNFRKKNNNFLYHVPFADSFRYANGSPYPIIEKEGVLWFGKSNAGILSLHIASGAYTLFPFPQDGNFNYYADEDVSLDRFGNIWFSRETGLYRFNIKSHTWQSYLLKIKLKEICIRGDELFIASEKGLLVFNIIDQSYFLVKTAGPASRIRAISAGPNNTIWIGDVLGGIYKFDPVVRGLTFFGNINSNSGNVFPVYELFFDRSEILWIGTDGMGLLKANVDPPDFFKFPSGNKPQDLFVKSIYEDNEGVIWLGTFGNSIILLNTKDQTSRPLDQYPFNAPDSKEYIVSFIREDLHKNLWVGFGHRIYVRKHNSSSFEEVKIPLTSNNDKLRITGMSPLDGKVFIKTTKGCFAFMEGEDKHFYSVPGDYSIGDFTFLHQVNKQQYISGYLEGGLHLYNFHPEGSWSHVKRLLKQIGIKCIYNDVSGNILWIGTDKGLVAYKHKNESFRIYSEQDGLNNSFVYGILESGGELWISTNGGLSKIKPGKLDPDSFPSIICKNYKSRDGLQADEFNTNAFLKGRDGTLYFGGIKGINWFVPKKIKAKKEIRNIAIVSFLVNDQPADTIAAEFIDTVVLPHTNNNVYIQFCGLEFSDPARVSYAFLLEGWDKSLIQSKVNEARYNNLPPGRYVFKVSASNEEITGLRNARSIVITILPPYWRTWWFYSLVFIFSAALLIWAFKVNANRKVKKERIKLKQQKEMYNERMRIAREMHDDIGAGLTQISLISTAAKLHAPEANKTGNELDAISNTARQLVDNLGEIIWALNPSYNNIDILLAHVREQISNLTEYADMHCHIEIAEDIPNSTMTNQQRRNILLVTKEVVHNAIKHCGGKNLYVKITHQKTRLHFNIEDDGKGFLPNEKHHGNGLKNIKHRIGEIGGVLELDSSPDAGCRYHYHFALG